MWAIREAAEVNRGAVLPQKQFKLLAGTAHSNQPEMTTFVIQCRAGLLKVLVTSKIETAGHPGDCRPSWSLSPPEPRQHMAWEKKKVPAVSMWMSGVSDSDRVRPGCHCHSVSQSPMGTPFSQCTNSSSGLIFVKLRAIFSYASSSTLYPRQ